MKSGAKHPVDVFGDVDLAFRAGPFERHPPRHPSGLDQIGGDASYVVRLPRIRAAQYLLAWAAFTLPSVALLGIFLPGMLLLMGVLPFWERLRRDERARAAMAGTNAAVVGTLG